MNFNRLDSLGVFTMLTLYESALHHAATKYKTCLGGLRITYPCNGTIITQQDPTSLVASSEDTGQFLLVHANAIKLRHPQVIHAVEDMPLEDVKVLLTAIQQQTFDRFNAIPAGTSVGLKDEPRDLAALGNVIKQNNVNDYLVYSLATHKAHWYKFKDLTLM